MKNLTKIISLFSFALFPVTTFADEIAGSGWFAVYGDGDKKIILFEKDGTFTYLNVIHDSGNQGKVYSDNRDTWEGDKNKLFLSFTDGYRLCSLKRNTWSGSTMSGSCINKTGYKDDINVKLIE